MHVESKTFFPSGLPPAAFGAAAAGACGAAAVGACGTAAACFAAVLGVAGAVAADAAAGSGGPLKFAPERLAMKTTARWTSSSLRSALPPFGGMAFLPLIALV